MNVIVYSGQHLLAVATVALSAWIFGEALLGVLGFKSEDEIDGRGALATALGLGLIAQGLLVLGLFGGWSLPVMLGALVLAHVLCRNAWHRILKHCSLDACRRALRSPPWTELLAWTAVAAPGVVLALYPPTGVDAATYHLPTIRAFLEAGRPVFIPELRFPIFPQVSEVGSLLPVALSSDVAARLMQFLAVLLTARLVLAWGRTFFSDRTALWAAALWLGTPLVFWIGTMVYVDVELSLFVTAAFLSAWHWERGRRRPWLLLAGLFIGFAAGTKYLGLFFCVALGLFVLRRGGVRPALWLTGAALLVLGPWYLRIVVHTGNPVFPFYETLFGTSEWTSIESPRPAGMEPETVGGLLLQKLRDVLSGLAFLVLVPWNAVFHREIFNRTAPLSPWLIVLAPLALAALPSRHGRRLLTVVAFYCLFWLTTVRDLRFFLPVMPMFFLALTSAVEPRLRSRIGRRAALLVACALVVSGPLYAVYKCVQRGPLPVSDVERRAYLSAQLPGYALIDRLNAVAGRDAVLYGYGAKGLNYYAEGRFLGDRFGPYRYDRLKDDWADGAALAATLREMGATHLLIGRTAPPDGKAFDDHFERLAVADGFRLYAIR